MFIVLFFTHYKCMWYISNTCDRGKVEVSVTLDSVDTEPRFGHLLLESQYSRDKEGLVEGKYVYSRAGSWRRWWTQVAMATLTSQCRAEVSVRRERETKQIKERG